MPLPAAWKPQPFADLIRVGSPNDGGYVLPRAAVTQADLLIGMGLYDDWTFEEDFLRHQPQARVICFDHTVGSRFWKARAVAEMAKLNPGYLLTYPRYRRFFDGKRATHEQIRIGYDAPGSVSLDTIMSTRRRPDERVFLKIDIEGSEYRIFDQILAHQADLSGLVIELHDADLHQDRIDRLIAGLDHLAVAWLHANNYGGLDDRDNPIVLEMALAPRALIDQDAHAPRADFTTPNADFLPELPLTYAGSPGE